MSVNNFSCKPDSENKKYIGTVSVLFFGVVANVHTLPGGGGVGLEPSPPRKFQFRFTCTHKKSIFSIDLFRILGIGLELACKLWRLMQVIFSNANDMKLFLMIFPRMSLHLQASSSPIPIIRIWCILSIYLEFPIILLGYGVCASGYY